MNMELIVLESRFAVCRLPASAAIPDWAVQGALFSITRTTDEFSVVAEESVVPREVRAERGRRVFRVAGAMDLSIVGVLASLTATLADADISLFALSTFDTDYLLVKDEDLDRAMDALRARGYFFTER